MSNQEIMFTSNPHQSGPLSPHGSGSSSCLLCGTQYNCYQLKEDIRNKWAVDLCQLYGTEIGLSEVQKVIENAFYCIGCHLELETINQICTEIQLLREKLVLFKNKHEFRLLDLVESSRSTSTRSAHSDEDNNFEYKEKDYSDNRARLENNCNDNNENENTSVIYVNEPTNARDSVYPSEDDDDHDNGMVSVHEVEIIISDGSESNLITDAKSVTTDPRQYHTRQPITVNDGDNESEGVLLVWDDYAVCYSQKTGTVQISSHHQNQITMTTVEEDNEQTNTLDYLKQKFRLQECSVRIEKMPSRDVQRYLGNKQEHMPIYRRKSGIRKELKVLHPFKCPHEGCGKSFRSQIITDVHFRFKHEGNGQPFTCDKCDKTFRRYDLLIEHYNIHEGFNPYECSNCDCDDKFATKDMLYNHVRRFHQEKNPKILCELCGKKFPSGRFNNHICCSTRKRKDTKGIKQFSCEICSKTFARRSSLQDHRTTHPELQLKQYKCTFCDKVLASRKNFNAHINKHTGNFKYRCELCNYGTSLRTLMKKHAIVHSSVKDHECDICHRKFKCAEQLKSHHNFKHSDGKNSMYCHICGIRSSTKYTLERHVKTVHADSLEKSFQCHLCSETFTIREYLAKHLKRSHVHGKPLRGITLKARKKNKSTDVALPLSEISA